MKSGVMGLLLRNIWEKDMFEAREIQSGYSGVNVLRCLSFSVQHQIYAILGANGAGKSTLMKTIARVLPLTSGSMNFAGQEIGEMEPHKLAGMGLSYVPQENNVFPDLTVKENLSLGGIVGKRSKQEKIEEMVELFPDIRDRFNQKAGSLSGGESQMVAVARALMQEPKLLLLDEPTAGLSPKYVDLLFGKIREIHEKKGVSVMLAEQNATKALSIADKVMILSLGEIHLIDEKGNIDIENVRKGYRI